MVLDVGNWDAAVMTNAPGQSGVPGSPHYGDLLEGWAAGDTFPLLYSRAAIESATVQRIVVTPAGR
jgi:penicillin G amidase